MRTIETVDDLYDLEAEMSVPGVRQGIAMSYRDNPDLYEIHQTEDGKSGLFMRTSTGLYPIGAAPDTGPLQASGTVRPGAMEGRMSAIEPSMLEKIAMEIGIDLEKAGQFLDSLGKLKLFGPETGLGVSPEIGLRDIAPFVGTVEDGKVTGMPAALQMAGRGESLTTGTGFTTKLKPDVTGAALETALTVAPMAGKVAKKASGAVERMTRVSAKEANEKLATRAAKDWEGVSLEYSQLKDSNDGQILNTDIARELSPEYLKDRTRSADVHEAASAIVKKLYKEKLAAPTPENKDPVVMFSAGGTGAGKTTGVKELGMVSERAEIVYDTNMNTLDSAVSKIDQALESGRSVQIVYTFRDPIESLSDGALSRATRQEAEFGTGRTVPIKEHVKTHIGARQVVPQLAERYKGDNRVKIVVIDNTRGKGNQELSSLDKLPEIGDRLSLERKAYEVAKQQYENGQISEATFRGTTEGLSKRAPANGSGKVPAVGRRGSKRDSGKSAQGNSGQVTDSSSAAMDEATSNKGGAK